MILIVKCYEEIFSETIAELVKLWVNFKIVSYRHSTKYSQAGGEWGTCFEISWIFSAFRFG